jgi:cytochrome P450
MDPCHPMEYTRVEGHDSSAAGLSWIVYTVGLHEDVQREVQAEIDQVCSEAEDPDDLTQEDLKRVPRPGRPY